MAIKLAPGGKVLMVLLGVGLIGYGLWLAGALGGAGDSVESGPAAVIESDEGPDGEVPSPDAPEADTPETEAEAAEVATEDEDASGETDDADAGAGTPVEPPPLLAEAPRPLRAGDASWWENPDDPRAMLRALENGEVDVIAIELHHLVEHGRQARNAAVIGALPPARPLALCAEANPVESVRAGARVGVGERSHMIIVAHVAEVRGIGASAIDPVPLEDPAADVLVLDRIPEDKVCFSLAAMGAQGPRIVLGRLDDVRLYGKSYLDFAVSRGALEPPARTYIGAPPDDAQGYTRHAAFLITMWSRFSGMPEVPAPVVARWVVEQAP